MPCPSISSNSSEYKLGDVLKLPMVVVHELPKYFIAFLVLWAWVEVVGKQELIIMYLQIHGGSNLKKLLIWMKIHGLLKKL